MYVGGEGEKRVRAILCMSYTANTIGSEQKIMKKQKNSLLLQQLLWGPLPFLHDNTRDGDLTAGLHDRAGTLLLVTTGTLLWDILCSTIVRGFLLPRHCSRNFS